MRKEHAHDITDSTARRLHGVGAANDGSADFSPRRFGYDPYNSAEADEEDRREEEAGDKAQAFADEIARALERAIEKGISSSQTPYGGTA